MEKTQENRQLEVESITEVLPCPKHGQAFISLDECRRCKMHQEFRPLGPSPKTGREMHEVECHHPARREVFRFVEAQCITEVTNCPRYKAQVDLVDCKACSLHGGVQKIRGHELQRLIDPSARVMRKKVWCGVAVVRPTSYVIKGIKEG